MYYKHYYCYWFWGTKVCQRSSLRETWYVTSYCQKNYFKKHESSVFKKIELFCADDCVKGRGRFYQGTVNRTKQGLPCQHWNSQLPHSHYRPPDVFPEVQNAENFCRNAGGEEPSPWCYTMDPTVRWQRCDIPICGKRCCSINSRYVKCTVFKILCNKCVKVYMITLAMVVMHNLKTMHTM